MTSERRTKEELVALVVASYAGFFGTWIMSIGRRAKLFETLQARGPLTDDALASELGYEPRYVRAWCRAAFAFELLDHDLASGYHLAPFAAEILLDPFDPSYMGGRAEVFPLLTPDFEMYPERMADGGLYGFGDRPRAVVGAMQAATRSDAANIIASVIPSEPDLEARLRGGGRMLDAGNGVGYRLPAFADAYPTAELVGIEVDDTSIGLARDRVRAPMRLERTHLTELPYRDEFDLVCANVSLSHVWGTAPRIFGAIMRMLKPGGWFLASEVPCPDSLEDFRSPAGRLFVGLTIYVSLLGPELLSAEQLLGHVAGAGFECVRVVEQPAPTRVMVLGRKPEHV